MLLNGNKQDEAKAKAWVIAQKRAARKANLKNRQVFKVQDGRLHHGLTENVDANLKLCAARRDINNNKRTSEIQALAGFSEVAIRMYAARIGVSTARMYRDPALLQRMIKDPDYRRFHLVDGAHRML